MGDRAVQHGHLPVRKRRICHARPGIRTRRELAKIYALLGFCYAVIIISYITGFFAKIEFEFPEADASLIFCPTYYAGCGATPDARAYLEALGRVLDPEVYLFWTGDDVVTPRITRGCAAAFRKIVNHRLIIWDNYPVNDRNPTLHLGPVTGRDPDLGEVASGYMSNPLCPQNEINRIPLFTCADFAYNSPAYDPLHSIGRAIQVLAPERRQQQALKNLVELYPGMLLYGDTRIGFNPVWERFSALLKSPDGRAKAEAFKERVKSVLEELDTAFPDRYVRTKETLRSHLEQMR